MIPRVHLCQRSALHNSIRKSLDMADHVPERSEFYLLCAWRAAWALALMESK